MPTTFEHSFSTSSDCFIGFKDASMPLTQQSAHYSYLPYYTWLTSFVHHGTVMHRTIGDSLNWASIDRFSLSYSQTELAYGFTANWPNAGSGGGQMMIYGNSNLYFY